MAEPRKPPPATLFLSGDRVEVRDAAGEFHLLTQAEACRRLMTWPDLMAAAELALSLANSIDSLFAVDTIRSSLAALIARAKGGA